ncbi:DNA polymerase III subunit delta [Lachnospira multipara]|uniref:DNA polymerase III subunit delta n=1 Tax=Lachnospira multipara TaxID=28051 RepID=UPI000416E755|nr:DNA polymerase III subunit delta [Lachnospira multipara]
MKEIAKDIKSGEFKKAYLIYGEETYLIKRYKEKLKQALVGDDTMNYVYYEGESIDVDDLISSCDTMPFFSDRKTIIVENSGFFKKSNDKLANYIKELPDYLVLIFVEKEIDKRNKLYKAVQSIGYVSEMSFQTSAVLKKWIVTVLGANQIKITSEACDEIIFRTGSNMELIKMELDKLEGYVADSKEVTINEVREIVSSQTESHIFEMIEALANHNQKRALSLYYELLMLKEAPLKILFLIVRQFNGILQTKELTNRHLSNKEIASALKLPPFVIGKYQSQAKNFSLEEIKDALEFFAEIDESAKQGRISDRMGVELAIVKYSSK